MKCIQCIFHNDNWWIPHASHNRSNSADGSFYTTGIFHGGRKSRADLNKPEDRRPFATYNFERDGALFIGTFAAAHGEARAELRVFPCAWAARSWVNYLDKSAWPPVCAMMVLRSTKLDRCFKSESKGRRTCVLAFDNVSFNDLSCCP